MVPFPERLAAIRKAKGVRQADAAQAAGITVRGYQYYEQGAKEPTMTVLIALADYFNVSLDYLVGRSDDPSFSRRNSDSTEL